MHTASGASSCDASEKRESSACTTGRLPMALPGASPSLGGESSNSGKPITSGLSPRVGGSAGWRISRLCAFRVTGLAQLNRLPPGQQQGKTISYEQKSKMRYVHGLHQHPLYQTWANAKSRCHNTRHRDFKNYGGRGIYMCSEWRDSFESFLRDMGDRPKGTSLDRRDNNGPYSPQNCRWASPVEQHRNTRLNHQLEAFGKCQTLAEWSQETGVTSDVLCRRLQRGWPVEKALSPQHSRLTNITYQGKEWTVKDLAQSVGMEPSTLRYRLKRGIAIEQALRLEVKCGYKFDDRPR